MLGISVPDVLPYCLAILGLLFVWQLHDLQVRAGRIKAADILHRASIRLFLHVTPEDRFTCAVCREAHGKAFLPLTVTGKGFSALSAPCQNSDGCRCVLIGLYGAWPQGLRVLSRLHGGGPVQLSNKEIDALLDGAQERRHGIDADRLSLAMLEATRAEAWDPTLAITRYREVIDHAREERDRAFVLPAYLRLTDLLEKQGRHHEAAAIIDRFLQAYGQRGSRAVDDTLVETMRIRRTRLIAMQKTA